MWTITVEDDGYYTSAGMVGGKIRDTNPKKVKGKNIGKKNETSPFQQALAEATSQWTEKLHNGLTTEKENAVCAEEGKKFYSVMLAKKHGDTELTPQMFREGIYVQPKLDGIRGVFQRDEVYSRHGKPFYTVDHISRALEPLFAKYGTAILDGELYNHKLHDNFSKLQGMIMKKNISIEELLQIQDVVKLYVYDAISIDSGAKESQVFSQRYSALTCALREFGLGGYDSPVVLVDTYKVNNEEEIDVLYDRFLEEGYEGQMIRLEDKYYNKRTDALLKRKTFVDEEFRIISINEGKGDRAGIAGGITCMTSTGAQFNSNIKADHDRCYNLLVNRDKYIGLQGTLKFFHKSNDGIPRFPFLIKIRDNSGMEVPF